MSKLKEVVKKIFKDKHILSLSGTMIFNVFVGLGFLLLVRSYSKEVIGEWIIYSTGVPLLEMFRSGLLYHALIKFTSGSKDVKKNQEIIGSIWLLSFILTLVITLSLYILFFSFEELFIQKGFLLLFKLFPLQFILLLPNSICFPILISKQKFDKILLLKLGMTIPSFLFLYMNYSFFNLDIFSVIVINTLTALPTTIYCIVTGSSGIQYIICASKKMIVKILNYGKFTMLTLLATNLLRSSDIFVISLFLTNNDVAHYGIPFKIAGIIENLLGSLYDVAMPSISKEANTRGNFNTRKLFYKYSFFVSLLLFLFIICFFFFRETAVYAIGGAKYLESPEVLSVLTIFLFSFLLHPIDRFSGISLDSINKPDKNLIKVLIMVLLNITGDILVVLFFKSIVPVAFVTLLNLLTGVIIGMYYLKKQININASEFFRCIIGEIKLHLKLSSSSKYL